MSDNGYSREQVEGELAKCENRLSELVAADSSGAYGGELEAIGAELKSCKLELGQIEHRSDDEWEEAKHGVVRRLNEVKNSLNRSARRML